MKLYAWAHAMTPGEAAQAADRFPGLGLVLYGSNLGAAEHLDVPPIAYISSISGAAAVAERAAAGVRFRAAIVLDERNGTGPSGKAMTPTAYAAVYRPMRELLTLRVPVHTMGLMPTRSWWRDALRARGFDDAYHRQLPDADGRAFNPNGVRLAEVRRALRTYDDRRWILSPAPFRGWWDRLWSPISVPRWARISERADVTAVAFWCLREIKHGARWQAEHGLIDRHDRLTVVGRAVQRELANANA